MTHKTFLYLLNKLVKIITSSELNIATLQVLFISKDYIIAFYTFYYFWYDMIYKKYTC